MRWSFKTALRNGIAYRIFQSPRGRCAKRHHTQEQRHQEKYHRPHGRQRGVHALGAHQRAAYQRADHHETRSGAGRREHRHRSGQGGDAGRPPTQHLWSGQFGHLLRRCERRPRQPAVHHHRPAEQHHQGRSSTRRSNCSTGPSVSSGSVRASSTSSPHAASTAPRSSVWASA